MNTLFLFSPAYSVPQIITNLALKFIAITVELLHPYFDGSALNDGQLMTVKIIYNEINQIGVPESAVTIQGNTSFVYIVKDDIAEKRDIKIGNRNFGKVSVQSGIKEGDLVISEGVSKVRNKTKVKIIKTK